MSRARRAAIIMFGLGLVAACGDNSGLPGFADAREGPDGMVGPDGGMPDVDGSVDAMPPPDGATDLEGPSIQILQPTAPAAGDFGSDAIVVADRFTALCDVQPNAQTGTPVDASSVRITAFGGGMERDVFAQPTTVPGQYRADFDVSSFPNGALVIRCTASDTAEMPRTNSAEISTFLDLGPAIAVFVPAPLQSFANQADILFRVTAAPVAAADTMADPDLDAVTVSVAGVQLTDLTDLGAGMFQATAVFDDPMFDPSLEGQNTLTIAAPNMRGPSPVTRVTSTVFIADSQGPVFSLVEPTQGQLVAGIVDFTVTITDPAGIDDLSVIGTVAGNYEFPLFEVAADTYSGSFDTRELPDGMIFPTVVIRAKDAIGNQSDLGFLVALDNNPPIVDLDPPDLREVERNDEGLFVCSLAFDPVGDDAVDDGESVAQLSELRARIEDIGNDATAASSVIIPKALVDLSAVQMFIVDDETRAIVVDTDGDGVCDEINPVLVPTSVPMASNEAAVLDLVALEPDGSSHFSDDTYAPPFEFCNSPGSTDPPPFLCEQSTNATRIIEDTVADEPAIYTIPPVTEVSCMGNAFDSLATNISDGWACVAVRAPDQLGNIGVSRPLRVCIDRDGDGSEGCPTWGEITTAGLPDCTGTYDAMTDTTDDAMDCVLPYGFVDFPGLSSRRIDL